MEFKLNEHIWGIFLSFSENDRQNRPIDNIMKNIASTISTLSNNVMSTTSDFSLHYIPKTHVSFKKFFHEEDQQDPCYEHNIAIISFENKKDILFMLKLYPILSRKANNTKDTDYWFDICHWFFATKRPEFKFFILRHLLSKIFEISPEAEWNEVIPDHLLYGLCFTQRLMTSSRTLQGMATKLNRSHLYLINILNLKQIKTIIRPGNTAEVYSEGKTIPRWKTKENIYFPFVDACFFAVFVCFCERVSTKDSIMIYDFSTQRETKTLSFEYLF